MNKTIIIPIIALAALVAKRAFNFEISQPEMDILADGVLAVATLWGILINPKKEEATRPVG